MRCRPRCQTAFEIHKNSPGDEGKIERRGDVLGSPGTRVGHEEGVDGGGYTPDSLTSVPEPRALVIRVWALDWGRRPRAAMTAAQAAAAPADPRGLAPSLSLAATFLLSSRELRG